MMWFAVIVVVLVIGVAAAVAAGPFGRLPQVETRLGQVPPSRGIGPDDLRTVRFSLAFRGYRMDEVDDLLDRLATQLESNRTASVGE